MDQEKGTNRGKKIKLTFTRFVLASRCCRCSSCLAFWSSCLRRLASSSFSFFNLSSSSFLCWISSDVGLWATGLPGKKLFKFPSKFEGALAGDARTRDLNLQYIRITINLIRFCTPRTPTVRYISIRISFHAFKFQACRKRGGWGALDPPFFGRTVNPISHCAFSSNLFHGHLAQIYIDQVSDPENKKCSPWKVFGKNHPQILQLLSRRGPRSPEARLSQHYIGP